MNIATGFTGIFNTSTVDDRGTVVAADWAYFRITNLDDTNYIILRFYDGADSQFFKLSAGQSFMMMNPSMEIDTGGQAFTAFADITTISAQAPTAACDVEVLIITAPFA
jgi:hypothetical protein